jgi:hypothetical protein
MAYTFATNIPAGKSVQRAREDKEISWAYYAAHHFTTELDATAVSLNDLIRQQTIPNTTTPQQIWGERTHITIANNHATQTIYVSKFSNVSSTKYTYSISPGGNLTVPCNGQNDLYLIGSGADTVCQIVENG